MIIDRMFCLAIVQLYKIFLSYVHIITITSAPILVISHSNTRHVLSKKPDSSSTMDHAHHGLSLVTESRPDLGIDHGHIRHQILPDSSFRAAVNVHI